jgi:ubiquinone/menaquinone biosynthesis C-methylase UbiE
VSTSLVYRSALGYELLMHALYGHHYRERMTAVTEQVPPGSSVLELCCGPGTLYLRHLLLDMFLVT